MTDPERDLRAMMNRTAEGVHHVPRPSLKLIRRARLRRARTTVLAGVATLALVIGGFAGARALSIGDEAPVRPAEENEQETEPMRNGPIVRASGYWNEDSAPPPRTGKRSLSWEAFDQDTGSFLYGIEGRLWVVGEDGLVAEVDCPPSAPCAGNEAMTFGPGPDEITVPLSDNRSVQIIGFDGTLRDTLDISAVLSQGQDRSDLAWSPDGTRLAVSTVFWNSTQCEPSSGPCGSVWILDRDGGEPQLVYTEHAAGYTVLRDLAWSPDGDTLALLVAPSGFCSGSTGQEWPRLVTLRMAPDEPIRAETLSVYDDYAVGEKVCVVSSDFHRAFPFAWSPDGRRIAVHRGDGVAEISAENGEVLDRHPGEGPQGPLAWLPER